MATQLENATAPVALRRPRAVTPLEKVADTYLAGLEARGLRPGTIERAAAGVRALAEFARAKGHTAWRTVGPATVAEYLADNSKHRPQTQTFFRWLARADHPVTSVLDYFGRGRWKRPEVDTYANHALNYQLERFLDYGLRVRRWSPNTLVTYRIQTRRLRDFLIPRGHTEWGEVRHEDLDDYAREVHARGARPATSRCVHSVLRSFCDYLDAVDVRRNDTRLMARPPKQPRRIPDHLTVPEAKHLLESICGDRPLDLRDRAILEFAYRLGVSGV